MEEIDKYKLPLETKHIQKFEVEKNKRKTICIYDKNKTNNKYCENDYTHRKFLFQELAHPKEQGKQLTIILLNPSTARSYKLDPTITYIKNTLENKKYASFASFAILNLAPTRETKSTELKNRLNIEECKANLEFIKEYIDKNNDMEYILAWGNMHKIIKYKDNSNEKLVSQAILEKLQKRPIYSYVNRLTSEKQPLHFSQQAFNALKKKYPELEIGLKQLKIEKDKNGTYFISFD